MSLGYDPARRVLDVEFIGGAVYRYFDVPHAAVETLLAAASIGRTFNRWVRDRYRCARVG